MTMLSNYSSASLQAVSASVKSKRLMMASLDRLSTGKRTINEKTLEELAVQVTKQIRVGSPGIPPVKLRVVIHIFIPLKVVLLKWQL